jgi:hypothetical protein
LKINQLLLITSRLDAAPVGPGDVRDVREKLPPPSLHSAAFPPASMSGAQELII